MPPCWRVRRPSEPVPSLPPTSQATLGRACGNRVVTLGLPAALGGEWWAVWVDGRQLTAKCRHTESREYCRQTWPSETGSEGCEWQLQAHVGVGGGINCSWDREQSWGMFPQVASLGFEG